MEETKKAERKTSVIKNLKAEFKKIIWPDKETLFKKSVAVILSSVCVGAFVALLDMVIKLALKFVI